MPNPPYLASLVLRRRQQVLFAAQHTPASGAQAPKPPHSEAAEVS